MDLSSFEHFSIIEEENACIAMVKYNSLCIFNNQDNQGHFFSISVSFTLWMIHDYANNDGVLFDHIYIHLYFKIMMLT